MINPAIRMRSAFLLSIVISLCGSIVIMRAQHGSGAGGGVIGTAGAAMKVPAKKTTTRTTPTSTRPPRTGTRTPTINNTAQMEDALSLADDARTAERYEAAERGYQLAAKLAPADPRPYLGLGHTYYSQKKWPEAEKAYTRAASLSQSDSEPYARLAFTYTETQRLEEALAMARRSVTVQPDNYYGYLALGYVQFLRRSYVDAEAAYRKAVSLAPQPLVVLHLELARVLGEQRRYSDAAAESKEAIDIDPKNYSARFNYAIMLQKLGQLVPSAQQYLEAIKLNDKDSSPHSNIGLIYYMSENFAAAREHWKAAVGLGSTYPPDQIGLLVLDGRFAEARTQLEAYTQKSGEDEDGWLMLGDVLRALGDDARARMTDARAAQIAPEYVGLRRPDLKSLRGGGNSQNGNNSQWNRPSNADVVIQRVYLAKSNNGRPGEPALSFSPSDRTIFCMIEFNVARAGTQVRFVWKTVEIDGSRNEEIKTVDYTTKAVDARVQGNLTLPRDWPAGTYKVDIYINGTFNRTVNYRVN
jgi:tetratricopeptide (TPR) repeat protein